MRVEAAALQLATTFGDVDGNLGRFAEAVSGLDRDVDLIVAPELTNSGYDLDGIAAQPDLAETLDGPTVTLARRLAADRQATVVVGLLEDGGAGTTYDTAVVVSRQGTVTPYRKTHLYPPETVRFTAGNELVSVPDAAGHLGVLICFEHAFPELATALALRGARILAIPSAVPSGYEHVLHLRSRARAQDNQMFVVACNAVSDIFAGQSLIADPRGRVLAQAGDTEEVIHAELDLTAVDAERRREPALRLRRPELYS